MAEKDSIISVFRLVLKFSKSRRLVALKNEDGLCTFCHQHKTCSTINGQIKYMYDISRSDNVRVTAKVMVHTLFGNALQFAFMTV